MEMRFQISSAKWWPFCLGFNVLSPMDKVNALLLQQKEEIYVVNINCCVMEEYQNLPERKQDFQTTWWYSQYQGNVPYRLFYWIASKEVLEILPAKSWPFCPGKLYWKYYLQYSDWYSISAVVDDVLPSSWAWSSCGHYWDYYPDVLIILAKSLPPK